MVKKRNLVFAAFLIVIFVLFSLVSAVKVDKEVYNQLDKNKDVKVLVKVKAHEKNSISAMNFNLNINNKQAERGDKFISYLSREEIDSLRLNPNIEINEIISVHSFLQDSTKIISSNSTWPLKMSGINLTGTGQTVCVIDTGVNSTHPDLAGQVVASHCYCSYPEGTNNYCCAGGLSESASAEDNNGHGTHVSGIIASSGNITGIAPSTKIAAVKILNSSGEGNSYDLEFAINWCVNNAETYNITVISMSLGGGANSSYCNSMDNDITNSINSAISKNISVIVASGNSVLSDKISWPACVQNVTAIGATTKTDEVASYSNRWALPMLFAPGTNINSTWYNGSYSLNSGTSMAAPHVAGAIAILKQYLNLTGTSKTPKEIEAVLNNTGKIIYDSSSNRNYSRINVYDAIKDLSFGVISTYSSNGLNTRINLTAQCNYSSTSGLENITFNVWNSSSLEYTSNTTVSGLTNSSNFVYNFTREGNYLWGCSIVNSLGLIKLSSNYSVNYDLTSPSLTIVSPINMSYYNSGRFNVSLNENGSCFYSLNLGIVNNSMSSANNQVFSSINSSIAEGEYNVSYYCNDSAGNTNRTILTFYVDLTPPNVTSNSPSSGYSATGTQTILFKYNVTDSLNISSCSLVMNNAIVASNSSSILQGENNISYSVSSGSYNWGINCTDIAGNIGNSSLNSLTINSESSSNVASSGGGGGGGGGGSSGTTYSLTETQADSGFSKVLIEKDKIKFDFDNNGNKEQHSVQTNKVYSDRVDLTISSNPINITLFVAEEKKISFVSGFYNLYVKLNSINDGKANLTMKTINEPISASALVVNESNADINNESVVQIKEETEQKSFNFGKIIGSYGIVVVFLVIVLMIWLIFGRKKRKKRKK